MSVCDSTVRHVSETLARQTQVLERIAVALEKIVKRLEEDYIDVRIQPGL